MLQFEPTFQFPLVVAVQVTVFGKITPPVIVPLIWVVLA